MTSREQRQLAFINSHHHEIIMKAVENRDKNGYFSVYVTNDFQLQKNSPNFVQGEFDKTGFISRGKPKAPKDIEVKDAFFVYYKILWGDNQTAWEVKEVVLQPQVL